MESGIKIKFNNLLLRGKLFITLNPRKCANWKYKFDKISEIQNPENHEHLKLILAWLLCADLLDARWNRNMNHNMNGLGICPQTQKLEPPCTLQ